MKKIIFTLLAVALVVGCTKRSQDRESGDSPTVIKLTAGVYNTSESKAPIDAWANTPVSFAKGVAGGVYTEEWKATVAQSGEVTLTPERTYNFKDTYYLRGYAPQGNYSSDVVTFQAMDGTQDILLSDEKSGSLLSKFSGDFAFSHQLAQISFTVECNQAYGIGKELTSLEVNGVRLPVSMKISSGAITYTPQPLPLIAFTGGKTIATAKSNPFGTLMVEPGKTITLTIVANGKTYNNVPITLNGGGVPTAATAYTIAITMLGKEIDPDPETDEIIITARITQWLSGSGLAEV